MPPRTFAVAATVEDPLSADRLVAVLRASTIDAFVRPGGAASSAAFASANAAFWDVLVPSDAFDAASKLITDEQAAIERDGEANAQAAEEEAMSGENPVG